MIEPSQFIFEIAASLINQKEVMVEIADDNELNILKFFVAFNNSKIQKMTNTTIKFIPGRLVQQTTTINTLDIPCVVHILLLIGLFFEDDIDIDIVGVTNHVQSIDLFKIVYWFIFKLLEVRGFELSIKKRGFYPGGDGLVNLKLKNYQRSKDLKKYQSDFSGFQKSYFNFKLIKMEPIDKIRGMVISSHLGSDFVCRMTRVIKEECKKYLSDVKVLNIVDNKNTSGPSPGFECSVFAETRHGIFYYMSPGSSDISPEDLAGTCVRQLLNAINNELVIDKKLLNIVFFYMANGIGVGQVICKGYNPHFLKFLKKVFMIDYTVLETAEYKLIKIIGRY